MTLQPPSDSLPPFGSPEMAAGEERPVSRAAIVSLICGILFCIPILTGALAAVAGIVGIMHTGEMKKRGRWMAVAGLLLGIASIGIWTLGGGGFVIAYVYSHMHSETADAQGAVTATKDFLRAISDDNSDAVEKHNGSLNEAGLKAFEAYCKRQGSFIDADVNSSVSNDTAEISGTVTYTLQNQNLRAELHYVAGVWRVTSIDLEPMGQRPAETPAPDAGDRRNSSPVHAPVGGNEEVPSPTPVPAPMPIPAPAPMRPPVQQPLTNGAVAATQDFIQALSEGDANGISRHDGGFSRETLQSFTDYFKPLGKVVSSNLTGETSPESTTVTGTITFENGKQTVKASLELKDAEWKVVSIDVHPVGP